MMRPRRSRPAPPARVIAEGLSAVGEAGEVSTVRVWREADGTPHVGFNDDLPSGGLDPTAAIRLTRHLGLQSVGWARALLESPATPAPAGFRFEFDHAVRAGASRLSGALASLAPVAAAALAAADAVAASPAGAAYHVVDYDCQRPYAGADAGWRGATGTGWTDAVDVEPKGMRRRAGAADAIAWCDASEAWLSGVVRAQIRFVFRPPSSHDRAAAARAASGGTPLSFSSAPAARSRAP